MERTWRWVVAAAAVSGAVTLWATAHLDEVPPLPDLPEPSEARVERVADAGTLDAAGPLALQRLSLPRFDDGFCGTTREPLIALSGVREVTASYQMTREIPWMELRSLDGGLVHARVEFPERSYPVRRLVELIRAAESPAVLLREAREQAPRDPEIAFLFLQTVTADTDPAETLAALDAFVTYFPLASAQRSKARLEVARDVQRGFSERWRGKLRLLYPPEVIDDTRAERLLEQVESTLVVASRLTQTGPRSALTTIVYRDHAELLAVTCAPTWSGGAYDGVMRLIAEPTASGVDDSALRHEATHAQLALDRPMIPVWFNEGVAMYVSRERRPRKTWALMLRNRSWIPFSSLEGSLGEFDSRDASLAYAQAGAMVRLLIECGGESAIAEALYRFRAGEKTEDIFRRLCERSVGGDDLLKTIERLVADAGP